MIVYHSKGKLQLPKSILYIVQLKQLNFQYISPLLKKTSRSFPFPLPHFRLLFHLVQHSASRSWGSDGFIIICPFLQKCWFCGPYLVGFWFSMFRLVPSNLHFSWPPRWFWCTSIIGGQGDHGWKNCFKFWFNMASRVILPKSVPSPWLLDVAPCPLCYVQEPSMRWLLTGSLCLLCTYVQPPSAKMRGVVEDCLHLCRAGTLLPCLPLLNYHSGELGH